MPISATTALHIVFLFLGTNCQISQSHFALRGLILSFWLFLARSRNSIGCTPSTARHSCRRPIDTRDGRFCVHSDLPRHTAVFPPHRVTSERQTADRQRIVLPEDNSVRSCLDYSWRPFQGKQFLPPRATAVERSDTGASAEKVST